jgi:anti-anti-sigma factor
MDGINISYESGTPVVVTRGRLDAVTSPALASSLDGLVKQGGSIVLNLSECSYLSSAGIRVLLQAHKKMRSVQGELYIAGAPSEVQYVLEIAGLLNVLRVVKSTHEALDSIGKITEEVPEAREWDYRGKRYLYNPLGPDRCRALHWRGPDIAGYAELGMAAGYGMPAESGTGEAEQKGCFVTAGRTACFLPSSSRMLPDFRVAADPVRAGVLIEEALSFGTEPSGIISMTDSDFLSLEEWAGSALALKKEIYPGSPPFLLLSAASRDAGDSSFTVILITEDDSGKKDRTVSSFERPMPIMREGFSMAGAVFALGEIPVYAKGMPFARFLEASLSLEHIDSVGGILPEAVIKNPLVWIWMPRAVESADAGRLQIDTLTAENPDAAFRFMIRRLYADSARVTIQPLHGGYSAQTFHVTSYDRDGRRLRPTVLKLSGRDLISREAERCTQYALPYIFNNSASVLGAEFHGDKGALRYNFVGIGGEQTRLKWLTHYYQTEGVDFLEPLLDKIFINILKPWYGQPVATTIYPFRDHDPTITFFPHIYDTVKELFSLSADEKYLMSGEPLRQMMNPYWFLKHEFKRLRDRGIEYLTGICHGDLNMQNILLDENMNVYLIDFSETRPRSVVSDFARLEAIYLVDNAPVTSEEELAAYLPFVDAFYEAKGLDELPAATCMGNQKDLVAKNAVLAHKMRKYAYMSARENPDLLPYYFSLLEWVFPVVCYTGMPLNHKKLAMHLSSILCEKIAERMDSETKTKSL